MAAVLGCIASRSEASAPLAIGDGTSIRQAKARFAEAAAVAVRGERVVVTRYGNPFVELVPAQGASGMDFNKAALIRRKLGLDGLKVVLPANFDDPAFSRHVLDLQD